MAYPFPPDVQQLVQEQLATGRYGTEDEVILEALELLRDRDSHFREFQAQLRARLDRLDRGEGIELEDEAALRQFFDGVQTRGKHPTACPSPSPRASRRPWR